MRSTLIRVLLFLVVLLASAETRTHGMAFQDPQEAEHQWHQWRGPGADGVSVHAKPPLVWSEQKNVAWKVSIEGEGISTPVVWKNRVFLLTAVPTDRTQETPPAKDSRAMTVPPEVIFQFKVICLNLETGKTIWQDVCTELTPHAGRHKTSSYAAASPATDGQRLIVSFGSPGIFSYTLDGKKEWAVDLGDMHTRRGWGEATSPVLVDDRVVVNWDNEDDSFIYVLDARTGETIWRVKRDEPTTWATPLIIEREETRQIVTNGTHAVTSYDLNTGKQLWTAVGTTLNAIPCPVEFGDSVIFMAGYRGSRAVSIQLTSVDNPQQNWEIKKGTPYVPSPLLSENRLYFTQSNMPVLHCLNAETGKAFYKPQRLQMTGNLYASPVAANGHVYFAGRDGNTVVIRDDEQFEVVSQNQLDDQFDASPVPIGPKLLLRGKKHIYCLQEQRQP